MPTGPVSLSAFPAESVEVACTKCERHGYFRKASLVAIHGPQIELPELRDRISADCPKQRHRFAGDSCGAYFPILPSAP